MDHMIWDQRLFTFLNTVNNHAVELPTDTSNHMRKICCKLSKPKVTIHAAHESAFNNDICVC